MSLEETLSKEVNFDVDLLGHDPDNQETTHPDILIYGATGAGKTYLAATAPQPLYVLTADPTGHKSIPYKTPGKVIKSTDEALPIVQHFEQGGHGFATLLVDGLSFFYDLFMFEVGQYFHEVMGAKDPDLVPISAHKKIINRYKKFIYRLINLSQVPKEDDRVNVIFTTLDERLKESEDAPFAIRPFIGSKSINEKFPAFFSTIAYIEPVGQDENGEPTKQRRVLFTPLNGIQARDRLGIFPDSGRDLNLSDYLK